MRAHSPVHINFNTGECEETFESKVKYVEGRVKGLPNPYAGNKRKLVSKILGSIKKQNIKYETALDLFSGSACVSIVMKYMGKRVITNDILLSSYFYANAFVANDSVVLSKDQKDYLLKNYNKNKIEFVRKEYQERFTPDEAKFLDNYRANIDDLDNDYEKALAFANMQIYISKHCYLGGRLNSGQILAELGHRIRHNRNGGLPMSFEDIHWYSFVGDDSLKFVSGSKSFCSDAIDFLGSKEYKDEHIDLAYIDPPYGGQQSDYGFMFNFFESYARQQTIDKWDIAASMKKFAKKKDYEKHFISMIKALSNISCLVISYNDSSWTSIDDIERIVSEVRNEVYVEAIDYEYNSRSEGNRKAIEYVIFAK